MNCWKPLRAMNTTTELAMTAVNVLKSGMDWAISSQASRGRDEGSTTRSINLEQIKDPRVQEFCKFCDFAKYHKYQQTEGLMKKIDNQVDEKFYYVYKITNMINNKIYIGCHQTTNLDDGYMGSGKYINRAYVKYGIENFQKEIVQYYSNAKEMFEAEAKIVNKEFIKEDSNYNLAEGGKGGFKGEDCYQSKSRSEKIRSKAINKITVKNAEGSIFKVSDNDPRLETKELVGITKGQATVKDKNGKILKVDVDDPRINSGELVGNTKGLAVMKDKFGNRFQVPINDPRINSGELVGNTKGSTQSIESNRKRSEAQKGIKKPATFASCVFCRKTTSITNIIRWHKSCS